MRTYKVRPLALSLRTARRLFEQVHRCIVRELNPMFLWFGGKKYKPRKEDKGLHECVLLPLLQEMQRQDALVWTMSQDAELATLCDLMGFVSAHRPLIEVGTTIHCLDFFDKDFMLSVTMLPDNKLFLDIDMWAYRILCPNEKILVRVRN